MSSCLLKVAVGMALFGFVATLEGSRSKRAHGHHGPNEIVRRSRSGRCT